MKELKMETRSIVTQTSNSIIQGQQRIETDSLINTVFLNIAILATCFALIIPIFAYISKQRQHKFNHQQHYKVACHHCQYFNSNHYLQCTLHPKTVMTKEAIDCKDYYPNPQAKRFEELKKSFPLLRNIFRE
jgi:hypothetical protein